MHDHGIAPGAVAIVTVIAVGAMTLNAVSWTWGVARVVTDSAIFLLMYVMCIVSYLRVRGLTVRSGANAVLLAGLAVSLVQSGWRSVYGLVVLAATLVVLLLARRRRDRPRAVTESLSGALLAAGGRDDAAEKAAARDRWWRRRWPGRMGECPHSDSRCGGSVS